MAVVFCNNNIEKVMYSGYTIDKIYACGGELVYSYTPPTPQDNWKAKVYSNDSIYGDLYAYIDCSSTSSITSSDTSSWIASTSGGQIVPIAITDINALWIGECTTSIERNAFKGFTGLQYISNFGANLVSIGNTAFSGDTSLERVTFGCKLETIGNGAFHKCTSLSSLTFCYSDCALTTIGGSAFYGCTSLTSIHVPNTVTSIGSTVFGNCTNLTRIYMTSSTPPSLGSYAFYNVSPDFDIIVPQGSLNAYKTASGWSEYANIIYTT